MHDVAKLMGQADGPSQHLTESNDTSAICQWARGEALMLKNQCRHNTVTSERFGHLVTCGKVLIPKDGGVAQMVRAWDS